MVETSHYTWQPEGSDRLIQLSFEVLDRILQDVLRGFGAIPKRGAEVGGILLGRAAGNTITVESYEPVACDYRLGPSYHLTGSDEERFEVAMASFQDSAELRPVGFYRSDTRDKLTLDEEDRKLLDRWFPEPSAIVLLIRPFATKVSRAGFFYRVDGQFLTETPLEFPFSRKLLGGGGSPRAKKQPAVRQQKIEAEPAHVPDSTLETTFPAFVEEIPEIAPARSNKSLWAAGLALAVALGWSGGYFTARNLPSPPNPDDYRLALAVTPRLYDLNVVWDSKSPALETAIRGQLRIREGGLEKTVPLDLEQLRLGAVVYRNIRGPVRFELEIQQIAGTVIREAREFTPPPESLSP